MEKAILIGVKLKKSSKSPASQAGSMRELHRLAETAGAEVKLAIDVRMDRYNPATFIGSGKAAEISSWVSGGGIGTVIFDNDLSPAQQRNLQGLIPAKIIDRTRLILDIFAQRARTREGKLQVELAQLSYALPRLAGKGLAMSQQKGGIGTRGPGERRLEYDRRRIREKIVLLKKDIDSIRRERAVQNKKRSSIPMPQVAIVGYTNAGKSTLLDSITKGKANVYADDKLFATLDPTTRRVRLPSGGYALFTDTVGFIQKLPHTLVAAFRATLEEILSADCIIHIQDASSPRMTEQAAAVDNTLRELHAGGISRVNVYNKMDLLPESKRFAAYNPVFISALTGSGVPEMLKEVEDALSMRWGQHELMLPSVDGKILGQIHKTCMVIKTECSEEGTRIVFKSTPENWKRINAVSNLC